MESFDSIEDLKASEKIKNENNFYTIVLVNIKDFFSISKNADIKELELLKFSIQNVASDMLNLDFVKEIIPFKFLEGIGFLIIFIESENKDEILAELYNRMFNIIEKLESIMTNEFIVSISKVSNDLSKIDEVNDIAQDLVSHCIIEPEQKVFVFEEKNNDEKKEK